MNPVLIWYSDSPVEVGRVFTPYEICERNRIGILEESPEAIEVERILEEVRKREYRKLPSRLCSIIALPFPYLESSGKYHQHTEKTQRVPEPFGDLPYCYWIEPMPGMKRHLSDEGFVDSMFDEPLVSYRKALARDYWNGEFRDSYTYLLEGSFTIVEPCLVGSGPAPAWEEVPW